MPGYLSFPAEKPQGISFLNQAGQRFKAAALFLFVFVLFPFHPQRAGDPEPCQESDAAERCHPSPDVSGQIQADDEYSQSDNP